MKGIRKSACLLLVLPALLLSSCASRKIPETTSEDWCLYARNMDGTRMVVNGYGQPEYDYAFDRKGNVIDIDRNILIGAENVSDFIEVEEIVPEDESLLEIRLDTKIVEVENGAAGKYTGSGGERMRIEEAVPQTVRLRLELLPENAMCRCVNVTSEGGAVELSGADSGGVVSLTAPEGKNFVDLDVTALDEGSAVITAASADGNVTEKFEVSVTRNETPVNEEDFRTPPTPAPEPNGITAVQGFDSVTVETALSGGSPDAIDTTENTPGWITGNRVNLRKEPGTTSEILGTYSGGKELAVLGSRNGWSKVQIDGKTGYVRSVYVVLTDPNEDPEKETDPAAENRTAAVSAGRSGSSAGNGSAGTSAPVNLNALVAANDGGDHGYAFSAEAEPLGSGEHAHDFQIASVVDPTEKADGYTVYTCSCGATYKGNYTAAGGSADGHVHDDTVSVVPPTCTGIGYTEHTCSCGETWRDGFLSALGHSFLQETLEDGSVRYTCTVCGEVFTEEAEPEGFDE